MFAYVNHARIRSWNQPVLSNEGKVSGSRKQRGPLLGLELTTDRHPPTTSQTRSVLGVLTYASAANANDFFILHGVTCAWAIYQFIPLLDKADTIDVLKHFMVTLFAVYIVQHAPVMSANIQPRNITADDWANFVVRTIGADRDEYCYTGTGTGV